MKTKDNFEPHHEIFLDPPLATFQFRYSTDFEKY